MANSEQKYVQADIHLMRDLGRVYAACVTKAGRVDRFLLGAVREVSDPAARRADFWTRERMEELLGHRLYSDAVTVGNVLVFVGGLERLVFISELVHKYGGSSPFGSLSLPDALDVIQQLPNCATLNFPYVGGFNDFGTAFIC